MPKIIYTYYFLAYVIRYINYNFGTKTGGRTQTEGIKEQVHKMHFSKTGCEGRIPQ
jgi:hypothetical protein